MRKTKLQFVTMLTTALLLGISCRKSDQTNNDNSSQPTPANHAAQFFAVPAGTKPVVAAIAKELERRNKMKEFVNDFAETKGFPIWNKAILSFSGERQNINFGNSSSNIDSLVYIPLVLQNATSTNGFLRAVINDSISLSYCLAKDYKNYSFTPSNNITTADEFASFFMLLDNEVFGHNIFYLTDPRLLTGTGMGNGTQNRTAKIMGITKGTPATNLCEGTIYTIDWLVQDPENCTCANGASTPGGICHDWETGCQACSNTITLTITVGADAGCGGTGGGLEGPIGGGTPISGGPSDGGTGGGAPPPYYPCQNIPTALLPEPLPPCPPPTGGAGWNPIVTYLAAALSLTNQQADFLNQNTIHQNPIYNYLLQNNSSQSVQICIDHINLLMSDPEYVQFANNHNNTGNPSIVWWMDDIWLDNPQNFTLDIDPEENNQYGKLTAAEKVLVKQYPRIAFVIHTSMTTANFHTQQQMGVNGLNDKSDAFRHAFFQALNTVRVGAALTQQFADAHESEVFGQLIKEKQMDLFNNSIGITHGQTLNLPMLNANTLANEIHTMVLNGQLKYLKPINLSDPNYWGAGGISNPSTATHGISGSTSLVPTNQ